MAELVDWLQLNWYLAIPWVLAVGAWLVARKRNVARPVLLAVVFFLIGGAIVLVIDLTQV